MVKVGAGLAGGFLALSAFHIATRHAGARYDPDSDEERRHADEEPSGPREK